MRCYRQMIKLLICSGVCHSGAEIRYSLGNTRSALEKESPVQMAGFATEG
jgi:biotin operon repressor